MKETTSFGVDGVPDYEWKGEMNYINLGALANYHIQVPVEKLDLYAGLRVGLEFWNWKVDYKWPSYEQVYDSYGYISSYKYSYDLCHIHVRYQILIFHFQQA